MELSVKKIQENLPKNHPWSNSILYFDTIDSTNTHAKTLAAADAPHGTVLIADTQTGGRGRMGRSFHSPAGTGIYLSVILRPKCGPAELMHLTCATGCAMCDAVEEVTDMRPGIKWINDLVWETKKLGGILTELSIDPQTGLVAYAVVGIGINCNQKAGDFPAEIRKIAISLSTISQKTIDRSQLAAAMITSLQHMDAALLSQKTKIMSQYRTDCITLGKPVCIHRFDRVQYGTAMDITSDGALVVQFQDGHTEPVGSGEVSVRGMYGYI